MPKPGGIRKGWKKQFLSISDFKLFFFDVKEGSTGTQQPDISRNPSRVIDLKYPGLKIVKVSRDEVIHANKKDADLIVKVNK